MSAAPVLASMTAWDVEPGTWRMTLATGDSPDGPPGASSDARDVTLERSQSIEVSFAPGAYTVIELALRGSGTPYWTRPDLGISARGVVVSGRRVNVTVHSLGASVTRPARL